MIYLGVFTPLQAPFVVYNSSLISSWQDYSFCERNIASTKFVHSGTYLLLAFILILISLITDSYSIEFNQTLYNGLKFFTSTGFDYTQYQSLNFWMYTLGPVNDFKVQAILQSSKGTTTGNSLVCKLKGNCLY